MTKRQPYGVGPAGKAFAASVGRLADAMELFGPAEGPALNKPGACPWWPDCGCGTQSGPHTCEWRANAEQASRAATDDEQLTEDRT